MATTYKILGTKNSAGQILDWATLYTVPTGKSAVISSLSICNVNGSAAYCSVQIVPASGSLSTVTMIPGNQLAASTRMAVTEGWTLSEGDQIQVDDLTTGVEYIVFGTEIG